MESFVSGESIAVSVPEKGQRNKSAESKKWRRLFLRNDVGLAAKLKHFRRSGQRRSTAAAVVNLSGTSELRRYATRPIASSLPHLDRPGRTGPWKYSGFLIFLEFSWRSLCFLWAGERRRLRGATR